MKYFINADDFGITKAATDAINSGILDGYIQQTSLIMNGEATDYAIELCRKGGYEDRVCFHLNLSDGMPLTEELRKTSLCNEDGSFKKLQRKDLMMDFRQSLVKALRAECAKQMEMFRDAGFKSEHIDSHKWFICTLPVWNAVKPLLGEFGFKSTRALAGGRFPTLQIANRVYYSSVFKKVQKELKLIGDWSGGIVDLRRDVANGTLNGDTLVELYVHPEIVDGVVNDFLTRKPPKSVPLSDVCKEVSTFGELTDIHGA